MILRSLGRQVKRHGDLVLQNAFEPLKIQNNAFCMSLLEIIKHFATSLDTDLNVDWVFQCCAVVHCMAYNAHMYLYTVHPSPECLVCTTGVQAEFLRLLVTPVNNSHSLAQSLIWR